MLLLPAVQYGEWATVRRTAQRMATRVTRGEDLISIITQDGFLNPAEKDGLLIMRAREPGQNFYCAMPWLGLRDPIVDLRAKPTVATDIEESVFRSALETNWGTLAMLSHDNQPWLYDVSRHEVFLKAALRFWTELEAVGARYYTYLEPKMLWEIPNNMHYVLANMGVPTDMLRSPLPPEGPQALLAYASQPN